jgi:hypothetical protein
VSEKYTLIAFCAILLAICYLATIASILAYQRRYAEALGFGGITTGLVGVLGTFKPRTTSPDSPQDVHITNPPSNPANVQEQL